MDYKEELKRLIQIVKEKAKEGGERIKSEDIASRLGYERPYLSQLIGPRGVVNESHILLFKTKFSNELGDLSDLAKTGDKRNPERALIMALLDDYCAWKGAQTGAGFDQVKSEVQRKAELILKGLDSWPLKD